MSKGRSFCALFMLLAVAGPAFAQNQVSDRVTANVQIVGEVGTLDFRRFLGTSNVAVDTHRALRYGGNVVFTYAGPMLVQPYLLGGFGSLRTHDNSGGNRNDPYVNVGLGFDFWANHWFGAGMQYRSYFVDNGTVHYFNSGIKIGLH